MMSPRRSARYGRSFSYQAPVPPKTNLFTNRWSPTRSVRSIDDEGILKACTTKLVPKRARITVTRSDSTYSERVVPSRCTCITCGGASICSTVADSVIPFQYALPYPATSRARDRQLSARLPFLYCPRRSPGIHRATTLPHRTAYGDPVQFHPRDGIL